MVIPKLYVGSYLYFIFMEPNQYISMALNKIKFNCQPRGLCLNRFSELKKKSYSVLTMEASHYTCGLVLPFKSWKFCPS